MPGLEAAPLADNTETLSGVSYVNQPPGVTGHEINGRGRYGLPFEIPNAHRILHGEQDMDTTPVTFNRYGLYRGSQLISGFTAIPRNWLRISSWYRKAGWRNVIVPIEPGKMVGGIMVAGYPARGPAPSQVQLAFNQTSGMQPGYPGGPGQRVNNVVLSNPGTGA